ncbi:MAG: iron-containing alcohol dehydrogenase [Lysinibacillus sp.]
MMYLTKQIIYGEHVINQLPTVAKKSDIKHLCMIYSASAINDLQQQQLNAVLKDNDIEVTFYRMPKGEPTTDVLASCLQLVITSRCDGIVAIGGGSALDLGKAAAALALNKELSLSELAQMPSIKRLPFIAVPTTAGTGSEATKVTVITDSVKGIKLNPGHPDLVPDIAILDPVLTLGVPNHITAFTGIDALTHAIEAYVSTKATILSDLYALQAIEMITANIIKAYQEPTNLEARGQMLLASYYAGVAFSNSSTNLAHAMGRALGTKFNLPHGQSVALLHPFVVAYSYESCKERYDKIATVIGLENGTEIIDYLNRLNDKLFVWHSATSLTMNGFEDAIEEMTMNALSGNGILTNRKVPCADEIKGIFTALQRRLEDVKQIQ